MRERLAKDKGATYTYSMDYVSQTVSLVDEFRVKEDQEVGTDVDELAGVCMRYLSPLSQILFPGRTDGLVLCEFHVFPKDETAKP